MRSLYSYSVTHLKRKKLHTVIVIVIMSIMVASLYTSSFYFGSIRRGMENGIEFLGADIIAVPYDASIDLGFIMGLSSNFYMNHSVFEKISAIPGVEQATFHLYFTTIPKSVMACCSYENVKVVAYDPETDFIIDRLVIPIGQTIGETGPAFYTGNGIPELALTGYRFNLYGTPYIVKGRLRATGIGYVDSSIFIPFSLATEIVKEESGTFKTFEEEVVMRRIGVDDISAVLVKASPGKIDEVKREIDKIQGIKAVEMSTATVYLMGILRNTEAGVWPLLSLVIIIGGIAIMLVFLYSTIERRREIGIFRAIGALRQDIYKLIIFEALILSLIGAMIGVEFGIFFSWLIEIMVPRMSAILPTLYPSIIEVMVLVVECFAISLAIGLASSIYPAHMFGRMAPDEAIREA